MSDTRAAESCEALSGKAVADIETRVFLVVGILLALGLRFALLGFESGDYGMFLSRWYDFIVARGLLGAFRYSFSNYPPLYLHLLALGTLLPIPKLYAIKAVSIVFDFVAAAAAYGIVQEERPGSLAPVYAFCRGAVRSDRVSERRFLGTVRHRLLQHDPHLTVLAHA